MSGVPAAALRKWWSKSSKVTGRVTQHLSPFEQKPADALVKSMPQKAARKVMENWYTVGATGVAVYILKEWAEGENDRYHRSHWD